MPPPQDLVLQRPGDCDEPARFIINNLTLRTWERQGYLQVNYLYGNKYLSEGGKCQVEEYTLYKAYDDRYNAFIGQCDENGNPDGLVRILFADGDICEGMGGMNEHNTQWNRMILKGATFIGWFQGPERQGNSYQFDKNGEQLKESGWFEKGQLVGNHNQSEEVLKYFEMKDVVSNGKS